MAGSQERRVSWALQSRDQRLRNLEMTVQVRGRVKLYPSLRMQENHPGMSGQSRCTEVSC